MWGEKTRPLALPRRVWFPTSLAVDRATGAQEGSPASHADREVHAGLEDHFRRRRVLTPYSPYGKDPGAVCSRTRERYDLVEVHALVLKEGNGVSEGSNHIAGRILESLA